MNLRQLKTRIIDSDDSLKSALEWIAIELDKQFDIPDSFLFKQDGHLGLFVIHGRRISPEHMTEFLESAPYPALEFDYDGRMYAISSSDSMPYMPFLDSIPHPMTIIDSTSALHDNGIEVQGFKPEAVCLSIFSEIDNYA